MVMYMNLIPDRAKKLTPNYFCTWKHQADDRNDGFAPDNISEHIIFERENPWIELFPEIRSELFFLLDDGWDLSLDTPKDRLKYCGTLYPAEDKFPSLHGTQTERLTQLNERIKAHGWRGVGLWVASNALKNGELVDYQKPDPVVDQYWLDRILMCRDAGIEYWKVDWGNMCDDNAFRLMMTELGKEHYPELIIEHGRGHAPFNGLGLPDSCRTVHAKDYFYVPLGFSTFSDVLRIYDLSGLSHSTALDRIDTYARYSNGILNSEDEAYMGAVLGCSIGIMQSHRIHPRGEEPIAAVRWHRVAPAFVDWDVRDSEKILTDTQFFHRCCGLDEARNVCQQAPAVVTRRTALPEVCNGDEEGIAFVAASLNPEGAYSVGSFTRQSAGMETVSPAVICRPEEAVPYIGVFGNFETVSFDFARTGRCVSRVCAQGLIRGDGEDVTAEVLGEDGMIRLNQAFLDRFNHANDASEPAVMLAIEY